MLKCYIQCTLTLTDPFFTHSVRLYAVYWIVCLCFVDDNKADNDCICVLLYYRDFDVNLIWLLHLFQLSDKTLIQKQTTFLQSQHHKHFKGFSPTAAFFLFTPKGRENDAYQHPVECSRYGIRALWCSIALCWFPLGRSVENTSCFPAPPFVFCFGMQIWKQVACCLWHQWGF